MSGVRDLVSVQREQQLGFERGAAPDPEGEMRCSIYYASLT